jgi:murein DD-endopeptidase MepM/ murein hydrolase activator NlpD
LRCGTLGAVPYLYAIPSRPRRRARRVSRALFAIGAAVAVMLALPGAAPQGEVLDLVGQPDGGRITAQQPTPAPISQPAVLAPTATPQPTATPKPTPTPTPAPTPAPLATLTGYRWPIAHPRLTLPFGPTVWGTRVVDGERFHDGVDLATFCGDRITAAHDGIVIAAGRHFDRLLGWVGDLHPYLDRLNRKHLWNELPIVVVTDDGNGYRSVYAHFERIRVQLGQEVHAGQLLGYEGATGHATGCHLHYSLFSPLETSTFRIRADVVKRMKVPTREIARVDPLQVLPPKAGINAPRPHNLDSSPAPGTPTSP